MIYLDSCVLIYAVERPDDLGAQVRTLMAQHRTERFAISPLVMHEVLVLPIRRGADAVIAAYDAAFSEHDVIDLGLPEFLRAAELRAATPGLKTPDSLHLAAAQLAGCTALWTNDQRLAAASGGLAIDVIHGGPAN